MTVLKYKIGSSVIINGYGDLVYEKKVHRKKKIGKEPKIRWCKQTDVNEYVFTKKL